MPFPRACRVVIASSLVIALLAGSTATGSADEPTPPLLDSVFERIEALAPGFADSGNIAVTVIRLDTRQQASFHGEDLFKAASVLKALWVAAALDHGGIAAAEPSARRALWASSNSAGGRAIDAAGGIDSVNGYAMDLGLNDSMTYEWKFDHDRQSRYYPGPLRGNNTTTTDDLARFWELVATGWALEGEERDALLEWSLGLKEESDAERLIARLPESVGAASSFKMGWLPVGRAYELDEDEIGFGGEPGGETVILKGGAVDIGAGIIRVPGGPSYVIAVGAYNGAYWPAMTSWVEYVSCVVYSVLAADPIECGRTRDPAAIRERRAVPTGELEGVSSRPGLLTVSGWAVDPDAWWRSSPVRITVDGVSAAGGLAVPTDVEDLFDPRFSRMFIFEGDPGLHEVCAVAVNDGNGSDTPIGCRLIFI